MVQDNERNLWISTDGGGISQIGPGWNLLKQFTAGKSDGLPHNNIKSIVYDPHRNNLYIGTYLGGLSRYDIRQHTFHNYRNRADNPGDIIYHLEIWNDKLYLTTRKGLFCLNPDTDTFQFLSNTSSFCEYFDISPQGTLYIMGWNYVDIFSLTDNTLTRRISMTPYDCYGISVTFWQPIREHISAHWDQVFIFTMQKAMKLLTILMPTVSFPVTTAIT